ncbi:MAG: hypothetical protein WBG11_10285 [Methylocella sp.]
MIDETAAGSRQERPRGTADRAFMGAVFLSAVFRARHGGRGNDGGGLVERHARIMTALGVRREKVALFLWVKVPSGNRSSRKQSEQSWR